MKAAAGDPQKSPSAAEAVLGVQPRCSVAAAETPSGFRQRESQPCVMAAWSGEVFPGDRWSLG